MKEYDLGRFSDEIATNSQECKDILNKTSLISDEDGKILDGKKDEWYSIRKEHCELHDKIRNNVENHYNDNIFYTLESESRGDFLNVGYCDDKFFITFIGDTQYDWGDTLIIFDSKTELLEFLGLDNLINAINSR